MAKTDPGESRRRGAEPGEDRGEPLRPDPGAELKPERVQRRPAAAREGGEDPCDPAADRAGDRG